MTESPEQRVARLHRELAQAKVEALQSELAEAQVGGAPPTAPTPAPDPAASHVIASSDWLPTPYDSAPSGSLFDTGGTDGTDGTDASNPADAGPQQPLAPAPRRVPLAFRFVVLPWSWWTAWALFMIAVAPIALWIGIPLAAAITAPVTFVVIVVLRWRRDGLQLALLRWGVPATVTGSEVLGSGTYYSGVTYQNVRMAQAHGWKVTRQWYSGPGTRTKVSYELNGTKGEVILHGLPYDGGVILAHSKHPDRALCVSSFAYDLDRDSSGAWVGHVGARVLIGSVAMTVLLVGWTVAMTVVYAGEAASLPGFVR